MGNKMNPVLESYRQRFEAEHQAKREMLNQITLASCILAAHEVFGCGPGRAYRFIQSYVKWKTEIAGMLADDVGTSRKKNGLGDREFLHTRRDLADAMKRIFGQDNWMRGREFFPMLRDFWIWRDRQ